MNRIKSLSTVFWGSCFCLAFIFTLNIPMAEAVTCSPGTTCNTSTSSCTRCTTSNRPTGAGYYKGGQITIPCSSSSPISCTVDNRCWTNNISSGAIFGSPSSSTPPTWKASLSEGCSSSSNCPDQQCKIKSCNSSSCTCSYTNAPNGTSCGSGKECYSGSCITTPTCVGWNTTVDSGDSYLGAISSAGTNTWTAVCEDFSTSNFIANYVSSSYTQNYSGTISSGFMASNLTYFNNTSSNKTRRCTFTLWHSDRPSSKVSCNGITTVRPAATPPPVEDPICTGYSRSINSGDTTIGVISASNCDRWSAVCQDFKCANYICDYESPTYTQNYSGTISMGQLSSSTIFSNAQYYNDSGSTKTRRCDFTVWNASDPGNTGTCVGTTTVADGISNPNNLGDISCTGYNNTLDSGETVVRAVSSANADTWTAVCEDFSCSGYICNYHSPSYTQNYSGTIDKTMAANTQYFNNTGSTKSRRCTYTMWNSADPSNTGICIGIDTVYADGCPGGVCPNPAPTLSFSAVPSNIDLGESTTLRYTVSGATSCTASTTSSGAGNWSGSKISSNGTYNYSVTPTSIGTKNYKISCSNSGGTTTRYASVVVDSSPIINGTCGSRATVYPSTTNNWPAGTFCSSGTASPLSPSFPDPNNSVSWTCTGSGGGTNATCTATREDIPAPTLSFSAIPNNISLNSSTTLQYIVSGAISCTASTSSSGAGVWIGSKPSSNGTYNYPVTPTSEGTKTYRISCSNYDSATNSGGTTTRFTSVLVGPPPVINGSCGSRDTDYLSIITNWPAGSTYCDSGTNTASPSFPDIGSSVSWDCTGSGGGTTETNCKAVREGFSCGTISCSKEECEQPKQASCHSTFGGTVVPQINCDNLGEDCMQTCPECPSDVRPTNWQEINP